MYTRGACCAVLSHAPRLVSGFERFAQGQLITLFSATNYCGTANNAGAILVIGRDLVVYPKLIHPLPPQAALDDSPVLDRGTSRASIRTRAQGADVSGGHRLPRLCTVARRAAAGCRHLDASHQPRPAAHAPARPCGPGRSLARPERILSVIREAMRRLFASLIPPRARCAAVNAPQLPSAIQVWPVRVLADARCGRHCLCDVSRGMVMLRGYDAPCYSASDKRIAAWPCRV